MRNQSNVGLQARDITILKMLTNPPQQVVNAGDRLISLDDGYVYEFNYKRCRWDKLHYAGQKDYLNLPQL